MNYGLVTPVMRANLAQLQRVTAQLEQLVEYPAAQLLAEFTRKRVRKPMGRRTFLWMTWSLNCLLGDTRTRKAALASLGDKRRFVKQLVRYCGKHYGPRGASVALYWRMSMVHAHSCVRLIVEDLDPSQGASFRAATAQWTKARIRELRAEARRARAQSLGWYLGCWSHVALRNVEGNDKRSRTAFETSRARLDAQLAHWTAKSKSFSRIELAVAAASTWFHRSTADADGSVDEGKLRAAASACFSKPSEVSYVAKRLVQITSDYGELHNLPWEEVFLLQYLPVHCLPHTAPVIDDVVAYVEARVVHTESGCLGLTDDSSEQFPQAAPYYSAYSIVLLSRLRCFLRAKLREELVGEVERQGRQYVLRPQPASAPRASLQDATESVEHTVDFLRRRLPKSQGAFRDRGRTFNTMLLFGPPGTGKTTLVQAVVNHFADGQFVSAQLENSEDRRWVGITITPASLLVDDNFARILEHLGEVFTIIGSLDHTVVFFDEVEELARSRESETQRFGRMFTAAMLLHLNDLKESQAVSIMATNYVHLMDAAAIRKGRFAIRKGLGWIADEAVESLVERMFNVYSSAVRTELKDALKRRPIGEIMDLRAALRDLKAPKQVSIDDVKSLLADWKRYLSDDVMDEHRKHLQEYDDSWTK